MFLVEVMGRHSGYIALYTAIAAAAEIACIPETPTDIEEIIRRLHALKARGKTSVMMVVAEGDERGGAAALQKALCEHGCPFEVRVLALGHLQRGGSPVPEDRILASRLGDYAVHAILQGKSGVMAGEQKGELTLTPLEETFSSHRPVPDTYVALLETLAT